MGYYVRITNSDLKWKQGTNLSMVLRHVKQTMFTDDAVKQNGRGGGWSGGKQTGWWYSWVDTDQARETKTIYEMIGMFLDGAEPVHPDDPESLEFTVYMDSKTGQESLLFETLAPYIEDNSFIEWRGEDGDGWKWTFRNDKLKVSHAQIVYEDDEDGWGRDED